MSTNITNTNNISLLYAIRILTIYFTAYPNSKICDEECKPIWTNIRGDFCGDIMYSGHMMIHGQRLLWER